MAFAKGMGAFRAAYEKSGIFPPKNNGRQPKPPPIG
jgi:hypothetical protein